MNRVLRFLPAFLCFGLALEAAPETSVVSPDGSLSVTVGLNAAGTPFYRISYRAAPIVVDSTLGIDFLESGLLGANLEWSGVTRRQANESYSMPYGTRDPIPDRYQEATIGLREKTGPRRRFQLIFRAYNEGIAFRYAIPAQDSIRNFTIMQERTQFRFAADHVFYGPNLRTFVSAHEKEFPRRKLSAVGPGDIYGVPVLIEIPGKAWVGILEANITDYTGMYLTGIAGSPYSLTSSLSPLPNGSRFPAEADPRRPEMPYPPNPSNPKVRGKTPAVTPWRVVMAGATPGELIEHNYLTLNLNEPCALPDTSWIKPGKAAWSWWSGHLVKDAGLSGGQNTATQKYYIDFAAEMGLEYVLIDGGWSIRDDITTPIAAMDIVYLASYARQRGVRLMVWLHYAAADRQMREAFPLYRKWGLAGVKIDFMNRDDQQMVDFYHRVARLAAENRLVVDFHGAYKPDGLSRTWPNLITREAVYGLEQSRDTSRVTPVHDVTLAFTRMLAGPMDYTPGAFRTAYPADFNPQENEGLAQGTRCHQLAMYVVYESPFQCLVDMPKHYRGKPEFEFIRRAPTAWDETRVLNAEVARYITIARRRGRTWWIGTLNNEEPREIAIPLHFLGKGTYRAEIYSDAKPPEYDAMRVHIAERAVSAGETIAAFLGSGGGHAMRISPEVDR